MHLEHWMSAVAFIVGIQLSLLRICMIEDYRYEMKLFVEVTPKNIRLRNTDTAQSRTHDRKHLARVFII